MNKLLAADASASGTGAGAATVTADDLTTTFNTGILAQGNAQVCLPR